MAPKTQQQAAPTPPPPSQSIVNNPSVVTRVQADAAAGGVPQPISPAELLEQRIAEYASSNTDLLNQRLTAIEKAKDADFVESEKSYWDPVKNASDPRSIKGVYLGSGKVSARITQHVIAVPSKTPGAKAILMRVNGRHILTSEIQKHSPGTPVRVTYHGTEGTTSGMNVGKWTVEALKSA